MNSIKRLSFVILTIAVVLGVAGCTKSEKQVEDETVVEKKAEKPATEKAADKPLDHPAH